MSIVTDEHAAVAAWLDDLTVPTGEELALPMLSALHRFFELFDPDGWNVVAVLDSAGGYTAEHHDKAARLVRAMDEAVSLISEYAVALCVPDGGRRDDVGRGMRVALQAIGAYGDARHSLYWQRGSDLAWGAEA